MYLDALAKRFEEDGYAVLPGAVSADLCAQVRAYMADLRAGRRKAGFFKSNAPNGPLFMSHLEEPLMLRLVSQRAIVAALERLLGTTPTLCQSMFFSSGSRTPPHQDEFYMAPSRGPLIGSWIAVQNVTIEDGPLTAIPGSHRGPVVLAKDVTGQWWKDRAAHESFFTKVATFTEKSRGVPLLPRKGDVIFFHGRVIHWGAEPATPERPRLSFVSHHCRVDAKLDDSNNGIALSPIAMRAV